MTQWTRKTWPDERWPNFSFDEMKCRCGCGRNEMGLEFMDLLQALRTECGFGLPVMSGYRCPEHNAAIGGGPAHPAGVALICAASAGNSAAPIGSFTWTITPATTRRPGRRFGNIRGR